MKPRLKVLKLFLIVVIFVLLGRIIHKQLPALDIPSNKNDTYAAWQKRDIDSMSNIQELRTAMYKEIDRSRAMARERGAKAGASILYSVSAMIALLVLMLIIIFEKSNERK